MKHYIIFDSSHPCEMNLNSLIDLPLSAFYSSFAQAFMLTKAFFQNNEH